MNILAESDGFEYFAHFSRAHQLLHLIREWQIVFRVFRRDLRQNSSYAAVDEKMCLIGITQQLMSRLYGNSRNCAEVDVTGNVLQTGQIKRIVMDMMTIMAHQRTAITLGVIILAPAETVVDQQHCALLQNICETEHEMAGSKANLADIDAGVAAELILEI